ncbi:hypothetical protein A7K73_10310 [Candidatus Methylacidiphilum fumarolicum]|uniref:Transporter n=2 Tax=Candidatus Methylacidiphilum fumarolicum TaxID=591154 RepID=I0JWD4_METFB|nr:hypothetical protein [Candidatus Methylacidiphilum fumarolicum]MBW6415587.1 hypothetical protein [Candidatus Methylacidiphilum fumarolicum]TFE66648.1 hypothetical protein A7K73_10310 [Candidatus Methylacidiphilum fumarolicum]TFE76660.1 hypothetical protein A7D33_08945 [Candidatus Methylacidiphilum fumarolicum]CAI9085661.1 conserved exported protein of unknown function [Candidatus Methylacidiphilum fumarolicum]CCG91553.1 conserved exported hypothetical protein [Methylacidiphilum fumariolicum
MKKLYLFFPHVTCCICVLSLWSLGEFCLAGNEDDGVVINKTKEEHQALPNASPTEILNNLSNRKDPSLNTQNISTSIAQETVVLGREPSLLLPWENSKVDLDSREIWSDKIAASDAPAGLMGTAHMHRKYQPMIGFWWMYMNMGPDYYQGSNAMNLNGLEAIRFAGKPVAMGDVSMFMEQYMPMLMLGLTDNLTFMAMFPIWNKQMDMVGLPMGGFMSGGMHGMGGMHTGSGGLPLQPMPPGSRMSIAAVGLGDVNFQWIYKLLDFHRHRLQMNLGFSVPTGSIDETMSDMAGHRVYPYDMQLGLGVPAFIGALTYLGQSEDRHWGWGVQGYTTVPVGRNSQGYAWGNSFFGNGWVSYNFTNWASINFSGVGSYQGGIHGANPVNELSIRTAPFIAMPDIVASWTGGEWAGAALGVNMRMPGFAREGFQKVATSPESALQGNFLTAQIVKPVYQSWNGVQYGMNWMATLSWQWWY